MVVPKKIIVIIVVTLFIVGGLAFFMPERRPLDVEQGIPPTKEEGMRRIASRFVSHVGGLADVLYKEIHVAGFAADNGYKGIEDFNLSDVYNSVHTLFMDIIKGKVSQEFLFANVISPDSKLYLSFGNKKTASEYPTPAIIISDIPDEGCARINEVLNMADSIEMRPKYMVDISNIENGIPVLKNNLSFSTKYPDNPKQLVSTPGWPGCFKAPDRRNYYIKYKFLSFHKRKVAKQ